MVCQLLYKLQTCQSLHVEIFIFLFYISINTTVQSITVLGRRFALTLCYKRSHQYFN